MSGTEHQKLKTSTSHIFSRSYFSKAGIFGHFFGQRMRAFDKRNLDKCLGLEVVLAFLDCSARHEMRLLRIWHPKKDPELFLLRVSSLHIRRTSFITERGGFTSCLLLPSSTATTTARTKTNTEHLLQGVVHQLHKPPSHYSVRLTALPHTSKIRDGLLNLVPVQSGHTKFCR